MNQSKATDILLGMDPSLVRYALRHMNHEASPAMLICEADDLLLLGTCDESDGGDDESDGGDDETQ